MIALAGAVGVLHLPQQRIHFLDRQAPPRTHASMTRHARRDRLQAILQRARRSVGAKLCCEILHEPIDIGIAQQRGCLADGDGTFSDVTIEAGLLHYRPTEAAAWGDFNNDGLLDLFIGNETTFEKTPCELYMNNGNGTFTNVAKETGMDMTGMVKAVSWGDYNNDGLIDLYISMLGENNMLMKNNGKKNGKWSFTNVAKQAGVELPVFSFPSFFFDYDNDGWLDLFVSDFGGRPTGMINGLPAAMDVIQPVVRDYLKQPHVIATTTKIFRLIFKKRRIETPTMKSIIAVPKSGCLAVMRNGIMMSTTGKRSSLRPSPSGVDFGAMTFASTKTSEIFIVSEG